MPLIWVVACTAPDPADEPPTAESDTSSAPSVSGETGGSWTDPDCLVDPPAGPFVFDRLEIQTEEDFDFDRSGYLMSQRLDDLVGILRADPAPTPLAIGIGGDAAGIRILSTEEVIVTRPDTSVVEVVDLVVGSVVPLSGPYSHPNGLEAGSDGTFYLSELWDRGRIWHVDPVAATADELGEAPWGNNLALSPDETTLYASTSDGFFTGASRIVALDRESGTTWGPPRRVWDHPRYVAAIATDKCGNLYAVEYARGTVFRLRASQPDPQPEILAELGGGSFTSVRFAPGHGGWSRTELLVTNRDQEVFVMDIGIDGRHVLAD